MNKIGAHKILGFRSVKIPILFSPALLLIKIKEKDRISVIEGGRTLQRVWLQASLNNISVQPYAAPGIFSLEYIDCEEEHKISINQIANQMNEIVQNGYGLIFLRMGYNSIVKDRTYRRPIESFKS